MKHKKTFRQKLATAFSLNNDKTAEEMLEQYIKDNKHTTLLERIAAIRNNSFFVPDYNKPKINTDVAILFQETPDSTPQAISGETITTQHRPVDFGNDIEAWFDSIKKAHLNEKEEKRKKQEAYESMMQSRKENVFKLMRHFLTVE